jgi:hypothetical protein
MLWETFFNTLLAERSAIDPPPSKPAEITLMQQELLKTVEDSF